jgi:hypothetical protein
LTLLCGGLFSEAGTEAESAAAAAAASAGAEKLQMKQAVADRFSQQLEISDVDSRVLITSAQIASLGPAAVNVATQEIILLK